MCIEMHTYRVGCNKLPGTYYLLLVITINNYHLMVDLILSIYLTNNTCPPSLTPIILKQITGTILLLTLGPLKLSSVLQFLSSRSSCVILCLSSVLHF